MPIFLIITDPCANKNCGTGFTCDGGACICGTSTYCTFTADNVCDSGTCKCGGAAACTAGSTIPLCLDGTGVSATNGDTASTVTCKVMKNHI